jgi:hypothetical protein
MHNVPAGAMRTVLRTGVPGVVFRKDGHDQGWEVGRPSDSVMPRRFKWQSALLPRRTDLAFFRS